MHEHGVSGRPVQDRRAGERRRAPRRRASRPRPVRPAVGAVAVRPAEAERPLVARPGAVRFEATRFEAARFETGSSADVRSGAAVSEAAGRRLPRVPVLRDAMPWVSAPVVPVVGAGMRMLARRPLAAPPAVAPGGRLRRLLAGLAATVVAGAVVVGLGLLAEAAAGARSEEAVVAPRAPVSVTVGSERSVWDVARRLAPGASGPELAVVAERIVTDNSLTPVPLRPGQVLRVTLG